MERSGGTPLRWGVDSSGYFMMEEARWANGFEDCPWVDDVIGELGIDFWLRHYRPLREIEANADAIRRLDAWAAARGLTWACNVESANWGAEHIDELGRDWYNHPDGRHYFQFPPELLAVLGECRALEGIVYDEGEHMQNIGNSPARRGHLPWVYDPRGRELAHAAEEMTAALRALAEHHARHGLRLYTEQVFPVFFHNFARAGWTAGTKVLKENWSPAYLACAIGAALQYGTELWVSPDMWFMAHCPGHTVDEYRSALLLAYHLGADVLYTEPLAAWDALYGPTLIEARSGNYRLGERGQVARWFRQEYVPAHPRDYTVRDLKPRVAIIRQPDGCWGQAVSWVRDMLYGNPEWHSTQVTEAWLRLWHLLSNGTIWADALSWHARPYYRNRRYQLGCPLEGVVVFDHLVQDPLLDGVEMIFLTGLGVSPETLAAVQRRVLAGATCVALSHLLPARVRSVLGENGAWREGAGQWIACSDFMAPEVRRAVQGILPQEGTIRYQFGERTVTLRARDGDPNRLDADVR